MASAWGSSWGLSWGSAWGSIATGPVTVTVPSVLGLSLAAAITAIEAVGLIYEVGAAVTGTGYTTNTVGSQSPDSGTSVDLGETVTINLATSVESFFIHSMPMNIEIRKA